MGLVIKKLFNKTTFLSVLVMVTSLFLFSCTSEPESIKPTTQGTENAGGGSIQRSTDEEVKDSVLRIQDIISQQSAYETTFDLHTKAKERYFQFTEKEHAISKELFISFAQISTLSNTKYATKKIGSEISESCNAPIDIIKNINIEFDYQNGCKGHRSHSSDASVSDFNFDSQICFNMINLMKIPKASLDRHIYGLWWHEIIHLLGEKNERVAQFTEKWAYLSYLDYADYDQKIFARRISKEVDDIATFYGSHREMFLFQGKDSKVINTMLPIIVEYSAALADLRILMDELRLSRSSFIKFGEKYKSHFDL